MDFVRALVEVDSKQADLDHEEEMAEYDKEAEKVVKKENEDDQ